MRCLPLVWLLSLALILSGLESSMLGTNPMASGSVVAAAKNGDEHLHHSHGSASHYSDVASSNGAIGIESVSNCCRSDGFHCGGTQAISSAAIVLPCFPPAQRSLPPIRMSAYVGPTLARLIRPPIV